MSERRAHRRDRVTNNRRVAPADEEDDTKDEDAGTPGKDTATAVVYCSSDSSSSSSNRFMAVSLGSRLRERQARRRVQPLGEDESEEARVRGVPVPAVGRLHEEELAANLPHHDHADPKVRKIDVHNSVTCRPCDARTPACLDPEDGKIQTAAHVAENIAFI